MGKVKEYKVDVSRGSCTTSGKMLIFGDLHLDPYFMGMHKDYEATCRRVMSKIISIAKKEKAGSVVFAGDFIGVNSKNIVDKRFLMSVIQFIETLSTMTRGNVYVVKGNHDMGDFTDFDFLVGLGYIKNPKYIDFVNDKGVCEVRFHIVNYGEERERLNLAQSASNVVIGHNDYFIDGVTTWYSKSKSSVELCTLSNFEGVDFVLSGHIHEPSDEFFYTRLPSGSDIGVFYMGNPTRVAERFEDCWYMRFEYLSSEESTNYECKFIGLIPIEEEFFKEEDYNYESKEEKEKEQERNRVIEEVINEVMESRLAVGNLFDQVERLPGSEAAKKLAKEYLEKAMEVG